MNAGAPALRNASPDSAPTYAALPKGHGEFLKDTTGKTLFQLQEEAKLGMTLDTPEKVSKFINDSKRHTARDMILEYYINALISGPITHLRYSVGNALNALWTPLVEIPTASAVGKLREAITGKPSDRVVLGEAGAQLHAILPGSRNGLRAAAEAWNTGRSPALPGEKVPTQVLDKTNAIPRTLGKVINLPSKSVSAIHSFFKSLRYEQNIHGLAYRTASREGLEGDAFTNRTADLISNPSPEMMEKASADALKELFMSPTDYHSAMGQLNRAINNNLAAKIIVPFMKIGSQITKNAFVERTPLGLFSKEVRDNLFSGGSAADMQSAKIATGVALMGTVSLMTLEGKATGDGPEEPKARAAWLLNHRPNSIQPKRTTSEIFQSIVEKRFALPERAKPPPASGRTVLAIPDLHCPFEHQDALAFLIACRNKYQPTDVICLGDEADFCAFSRFPRDPDGLSPGAELQAAIDHLIPFYREFPNVRVVTSNHTVRPMKAAFLSGLPEAFLPSYSMLLNAPDGWSWSDYVIIDGVRYFHGEGKSGFNAHVQFMRAYKTSIVHGHIHSYAAVSREGNLFAVNSGCLIDTKAYAFRYAKHMPIPVSLGCTIVFNGEWAIFIPLITDADGRWTGRL